MRSAECGVRSAECGVRSAECGVRSAECGKCVENFNFPIQFPTLVMSMLSVVNIYRYIYTRTYENQVNENSRLFRTFFAITSVGQ